MKTVDSWSVLKAISIAVPNTETYSHALSVASRIGDVPELVALSVRHALTSAVSEFLRVADVWGTLPQGYASFMNDQRLWTIRKTDIHLRECAQLISHFRSASVPIAFVKGMAFHSQLYAESPMRQFNDIDLMIRETDRDVVKQVLVEYGYSWENVPESSTDALVPRERRVAALYRLFPDHFPHLFRKTGIRDSPFLNLDVAFSLTWAKSRWQVPMDEVFQRVCRIETALDGVQISMPVLSPLDGWVHLVSHTFRDGFFANDRKDLKLSQFADVHRYWHRFGHELRTSIPSSLEQHGLGPLMGWVVGHTDSIFGSSIGSELGLEEFVTRDWLSSIHQQDGTRGIWSGDMETRLREGRFSVSASSKNAVFEYMRQSL